MKIIYKETEDNISGIGHGVEFHYTLATNDTKNFFPGDPIAFLEGYAWRGNIHHSITILIRPVSSPTLKDRGQQPEIIISDVKKAIGLFLRNPARQHHGKLTEHVRAWFNA
jgi:hypothetical protein